MTTRADLVAANEELGREMNELVLFNGLPDETETILRALARIKYVAKALGHIDAFALAGRIEDEIAELQGWCG